jgi:hypothetical protein
VLKNFVVSQEIPLYNDFLKGVSMKKLFFVLLVVFVWAPIFSQNVLDYFPVSTGNSWTYTNSTGRRRDIITVRNSMPDPNNSRNMVYLFEQQSIADSTSMGTTGTLYGIIGNRVVVLANRNILNQYRENRQPYPVELALPDQEWRQDEDGEYYLFKTSMSSIKFDDKNFEDCILVEQQVFIDRNLYQTNRMYYARGVGLVYKTLQSPGKEESVYQKLTNCNFTDINKFSADNGIKQLQDDLVKAEMFFFIKLAEVGFENIGNAETVGLENNIQESVFNALCFVVSNNITSLLEGVSSGNLSLFMHSPVPDFLITLHFGSKPFATGIDKAIKIIMLAETLSLFQNQMNDSVSDSEKKMFGGVKEAEPLLSSLYKTDSSISNDDYNNVVDPIYREYINMYLRHGGK